MRKNIIKKIAAFAAAAGLFAAFAVCAGAADYSNKVYTAYGDSITEDTLYGDNIEEGELYPALNTYASMLNSYFGFGKYNNLALRNSALAIQNGSTVSGVSIITGNTAANIDSDIITIAYGVNDFLQNVPIGTVNDTYPKENPTAENATFLGALSYSINYLRAQNPRAEILVITPSYVHYGNSPENENGDTMIDFANAIEEACEYMSVNCVNMSAQMGVRDGNVTEYTMDYIHWNQKGHNRAANLCVDEMELLLGINEFNIPGEEEPEDEYAEINPDEPVLYTDIADVLDTSRGHATGYDQETGLPVYSVENGWTKTFFNDEVQNFYITTCGNNIFGLFEDENYMYGAFLNNDNQYGKQLVRFDSSDEQQVEVWENKYWIDKNHYEMPTAYVTTTWHISYSETMQMWYFFTVDAEGKETFVCRIGRDDLESTGFSADLSGTKPCFGLVHMGDSAFVMSGPQAQVSLYSGIKEDVMRKSLEERPDLDSVAGIIRNGASPVRSDIENQKTYGTLVQEKIMEEAKRIQPSVFGVSGVNTASSLRNLLVRKF